MDGTPADSAFDISARLVESAEVASALQGRMMQSSCPGG
jgi:hypothetical protein